MLATLRTLFKRRPRHHRENLHRRLRGMVLMALSNKFGSLVLTMGKHRNRSRRHCTLYGDMCGGLAVISDVENNGPSGSGRVANCRYQNAACRLPYLRTRLKCQLSCAQIKSIPIACPNIPSWMPFSKTTSRTTNLFPKLQRLPGPRELVRTHRAE